MSIVDSYFQAFADARGAGTRYGPVHLLVKESEVAICGAKSRRWNFEGETEYDFCHRCLKEAEKDYKNSSMNPPLIKCSCCDGTGKIELSADHWRTLQKIPFHPSSTPRTMLDEAGVTPNAINNRLIFLESLGLIRRAGKDGKYILWEAVKP